MRQIYKNKDFFDLIDNLPPKYKEKLIDSFIEYGWDDYDWKVPVKKSKKQKNEKKLYDELNESVNVLAKEKQKEQKLKEIKNFIIENVISQNPKIVSIEHKRNTSREKIDKYYEKINEIEEKIDLLNEQIDVLTFELVDKFMKQDEEVIYKQYKIYKTMNKLSQKSENE